MQVLDCFVGDARLNLVAQCAWISCAMLFMYDNKKTSKMLPDICAPSPAGLQRSCEFFYANVWWTFCTVNVFLLFFDCRIDPRGRSSN